MLLNLLSNRCWPPDEHHGIGRSGARCRSMRRRMPLLNPALIVESSNLHIYLVKLNHHSVGLVRRPHEPAILVIWGPLDETLP